MYIKQITSNKETIKMNFTKKEQLNITGITFTYLFPFFLILGGVLLWVSTRADGDNHTALLVIGITKVLMAVLFLALGTKFKNMSKDQ